MERQVDLEAYQAVLFDLDGVITDTASLHAAAWKAMFDGFLDKHAERLGVPPTPFSIDEDYRRFVDGKPRYDGVRTFLKSRGIELPEGSSDDPPDTLTVRGLGNRKNELIVRLIEEEGVATYPGSLALVHWLRGQEIPMAIVSSSANARAALDSAAITALFDVIVDGVVAAELKLPGKPAPDAFLLAAERLGVPPSETVVIEDALVGVAAGEAGGFGLVV
ncbi:MAG: beta-phosphoglucomutase family hydrolase, partial [Acidimicrobiia bacterium]|nr:beta-phosphoglucomutase family hydrolase [Acidimicrobiia bacterium]